MDQSTDSATNQEGIRSAAPVRFFDQAIPSYVRSWARWNVAGALLLAGLMIFTSVIVQLSVMEGMASLIACGAFWIFILILLLLWYRRVGARITQICMEDRHKDFAATVRHLFDAINLYSISALAHEMTSGRRAAGGRGEVLRLYRRSPKPILPITVDFEPHLLDETDRAFQELEDGLSRENPDFPGEADLPRNSPMRRMIQRNILLKGGMLMVFVAAITVVVELLESIERGVVTWELAVFTVFFLSFFFVPVGDMFLPWQFLLVPGGIVRRTARKKSSASDIHVFRARQSVLCVVEQPSKVWHAYFADECTHDDMKLTPAEAEMLLRAWTSPLSPPDEQRLVDLT